MDPIRRTILTTGAAATAMATASRVLAQQPGQGGSAGPFYENGPVRIRYEDTGSGFPLMLIAGGGLNSTIAGLHRGDPFSAIEEFKGEFRCITSDLRNATGGQSSGPLEVDRPWDAYTDDQLGVMEAAMLAPKAEVSMFPWKEHKERIPLAVRQIRSFLRAHRPAAS